MKKFTHLIRSVIPILAIAFLASHANAGPYGPNGRKVNWVQPSGEKLNLRVFGDEFYARTETTDGYTVVYNPKDGAYHYAERNADGSALLAGGRMADLPVLAEQAKHIDLKRADIRTIHRANLDRFGAQRMQRWSERIKAVQMIKSARLDGRALRGPAAAAAEINAAPVAGDVVGLTILVEFPNDPRTSAPDRVDFPVNRSKIRNFCNELGYNDNGNTGSVRDYFSDQSLGQLDYTQKVTKIITMPRPRNFYNFSDYPANQVLRDAGLAGRSLVSTAISILQDDGFNFSTLTTDETGTVLATNLFFAGPDSGVWAEGLWPHAWELKNTGINVGTDLEPMYISPYQVTNLEDAAPVIGTYVHESGHLLLDYPDLYDTIGEGVGEHCLMGSGSFLNSGKTPAPINAYLKDVVGWANMTDLTTADYQTVKLPTTGNVAYRIVNDSVATESFIVENRGKGDKWAKHVVDRGIMIWHIDETQDGNIETDPYMVSLVQADNRSDLENARNRGDSDDLFDLGRSNLSSTSRPDSSWWDGSDSSVRVKVLDDPGSKVEVRFGELPPDTVVIEDPNGGEVLRHDSSYQIRWEANIVGSLTIDLYQDGEFHSVISALAPNTGKYDWYIPVTSPLGKDFTVRLSTISNPTPVTVTSLDVFEISDASFPENDEMPYGWVVPEDAAKGWKVATSGAYEGTHCLVSASPEDGKVSAVSYSSNFKEGTVSFYMRVSSEKDYDMAKFYIDGVSKRLSQTSAKKGLSGNRNWQFFSFEVSHGNHTFKWSYEKDDSYISGRDRAWLDGVALPATTQEIAVKDPAGKDSTNGEGVAIFPNTRIGSSSKEVVYTIVNRGKADLYDLKIKVSGSNPKAFKANKLKKTVLKAGKSTTFVATFTPLSVGNKSAKIKIASNDQNEDPFVIKVEGKALGIPELAVFQPAKRQLKSGKSGVKFGYSVVDVEGDTKTFTLTNTGSAVLKGLEIAKGGSDRPDFAIKGLGATALDPGESTSFKVTFTPQKRNDRKAWIRISNNYDKDTFDIQVTGTGVPKNASSARTAALVQAVLGTPEEAAVSSGSTSGTKVIDGQKYLVLTASKPATPDGLKRSVEVSPNLIDWFSGAKHTTVIRDNANILKVRDNTPVTPDVKRYIRLKTSKP